MLDSLAEGTVESAGQQGAEHGPVTALQLRTGHTGTAGTGCPGSCHRTQALNPRKYITKETSKPKIISGKMSTELTHQQVGKTFSKPYQRRDLNPIQVETTAHSHKQSLNLEPGHPPGSGHAMSTCIWERWK